MLFLVLDNTFTDSNYFQLSKLIMYHFTTTIIKLQLFFI